MGIKSWNVSLEEDVVREARKQLETGQALSPIINELLEKWTQEKRLAKLGFAGSSIMKQRNKK